MWLKVRGLLYTNGSNIVKVANDMAGKSNERELIQTYTESEAASLFLWSVPACPQAHHVPLPHPSFPDTSVLWRQLLETGAVSMTCIKIVQRTQAKKLAASARKMVDFIVFTCPLPSSNLAQFNQVCGI